MARTVPEEYRSWSTIHQQFHINRARTVRTVRPAAPGPTRPGGGPARRRPGGGGLASRARAAMLPFSNFIREGCMDDDGSRSRDFSLQLGDDLAEMRDWVHEFAAAVIRPAA